MYLHYYCSGHWIKQHTMVVLFHNIKNNNRETPCPNICPVLGGEFLISVQVWQSAQVCLSTNKEICTKGNKQTLRLIFPKILEIIFFFFFFFLWKFACLALFVLFVFLGFFDKRPVRLNAYSKQVPNQKRLFLKSN